MLPCALCENVQPAGDACEVCGHPFPVRDRIDVPVEPLADMEPTLLAGANGTEEFPAFEGLEATSVDPVAVGSAALEGLETTAVEGIPAEELAEEPPAAACRYCRTPALPGEAFCAHCGMRLSVLGGAGAAGQEAVLCRDCGTPVLGESCPACGVRPSR